MLELSRVRAGMAPSGDRFSFSSAPPRVEGSLSKPRGRVCLCAPTTHPGSFRCGLHRGHRRFPGRSAAATATGGTTAAGQSEAKVAAKAKSMRGLLMQIIGPSRQDLCRRRNFQPRPSRFGSAGDGDNSVAVA